MMLGGSKNIADVDCYFAALVIAYSASKLRYPTIFQSIHLL
jgi:hypothetical protein